MQVNSDLLFCVLQSVGRRYRNAEAAVGDYSLLLFCCYHSIEVYKSFLYFVAAPNSHYSLKSCTNSYLGNKVILFIKQMDKKSSNKKQYQIWIVLVSHPCTCSHYANTAIKSFISQGYMTYYVNIESWRTRRYWYLFLLHITYNYCLYLQAKDNMGLFWNSLLPIISIGIVCLKVAASDIVTITEPLVVTKDEDFSSRQTTLQCSSSVQHEYCCWSIPDVGDCHCREKSCQKGVKVTSDEKVCSITIDHSEKDITIAGSWSCTLLHDVMDRRGGNATSELFVVDLNEVDI